MSVPMPNDEIEKLEACIPTYEIQIAQLTRELEQREAELVAQGFIDPKPFSSEIDVVDQITDSLGRSIKLNEDEKYKILADRRGSYQRQIDHIGEIRLHHDMVYGEAEARARIDGIRFIG